MFQDGTDTQKIVSKLEKLFLGNEGNPVKKAKQIVKIIKRNNVSTQVLFAEGNTLMHRAVQANLPLVLEYLLAVQPSLLSVRNHHGQSPIGVAMSNFNDGILSLFKHAIFPINTPPPANKDDLAQLAQQFSELKLFKKTHDTPPKSAKTFSQANQLTAHTHSILDSLESDLEELLVHLGFEYQEILEVAWTDSPLWNLCASLIRVDGKVERTPFDKKYTLEMVQAILSEKTAPEIIQDLMVLWPIFDKGQKLTALFIVKELIMRDPNHRLLTDDNEHLLTDLMAFVKHDFQSRSTIISRILKNLFKTNKNYINNPVYVEYLNRCQSAIKLSRSAKKSSFEELLFDTLALPPKKQRANIAIIANEFDALSLSFIHNVALSEFYGCAWEKEQREVQSPNIVRYAQTLNQLTNFIQSFILQASSSSELVKRYSLFAQVAMHLAKPHDGMPPNYDAVIYIMSAINSFIISRVLSKFDLLPADDKKKIDELKRIADPIGAFRVYRELVQASPFSIIHPPRVQANIVLAGLNEDSQDKLHMLGASFLNFLEYQKKARAIPFRFKSDLLSHLSNGQYITDETQFACLSGQFAPIKLDAYTTEMFNDLLTAILKNSVVPKVNYAGIDYAPETIVVPVVRKIKAITESEIHSEGKDALLKDAKHILIELTRLINEKYNLTEKPPKLSPMLPKRSKSTEYEPQPPLLLSKKLSDLKRNQSYNTISVPSQQRRKLSIS